MKRKIKGKSVIIKGDEWKAEQTASNSITISSEDGEDKICSIDSEDTDLWQAHFEVSRMIEMAPAMIALLKDFVHKVESGKARSIKTYEWAKNILDYIDEQD
jgi:Lhr-like helicase